MAQQQPADDEYEDTATCPECHQPNVHPMSTVGDRRHYRCGGCMWSWWRPTDREVT